MNCDRTINYQEVSTHLLWDETIKVKHYIDTFKRTANPMVLTGRWLDVFKQYYTTILYLKLKTILDLRVIVGTEVANLSRCIIIIIIITVVTIHVLEENGYQRISIKRTTGS